MTNCFIVDIQFPCSFIWAYEVVWISFRPSEPDTGVRIPIGPFPSSICFILSFFSIGVIFLFLLF
jgi:hypothetical protein